jgi:cytochrome c-type biogenesis protein CcmE
MFRNRERMVKILGVLLAAALAISLVLPFLGSSGW